MSWAEAIFGSVAVIVMGVIFWKAFDLPDDDE